MPAARGLIPSDAMRKTLRALDLIKTKHGLTDKQLSVAMGLAETVVSRWRRGVLMSPIAARKVATYLHHYANKSA